MTDIAYGALYTLLACWILIWPGNWLCQWLLKITGLSKAMKAHKAARIAVPAPTPAAPAATPIPTPAPVLAPAFEAGRVIGGLERLIIAAGLAAGSWEILAAVIALKTVARFKEIDEQIHAEYFLVGSLFSIAWAFAVTRVWALYDERLGEHISSWLFKFSGT